MSVGNLRESAAVSMIQAGLLYNLEIEKVVPEYSGEQSLGPDLSTTNFLVHFWDSWNCHIVRFIVGVVVVVTLL